MQKQTDPRLSYAIVSPCALALTSYAFFLLSCLIPPSIYTAFMREPDYMFLDPPTILFYSLCVAGFIAGFYLIEWLFPSSFVDYILTPRISPVSFLLFPLTLGILGTVLSTVLLIRQVPNLFILLLSQRGEELKDIMSLEVEGRFSIAPLLLTAIIWWALWRKPQMTMTLWQKKVTNIVMFLATVVVIGSSVITVSRNLLMPTVCGLGILYIVRKALQGGVTRASLVRSIAFAGVSICLLFAGLSLLRGSSDGAELGHALVGYTAASYNRLAAVVDGRMHFPYAGDGLYLSSVVTHTRLLPVSYVLEPPDALSVWSSEFDAVSQASLDGSLIWPGAFGQIFSDLNWFAIPFVMGYGILYGLMWRLLKRGNVVGIVLYPWFGFCILYWFGTNYLLDSPIEPILLGTGFVAIYEHIFTKARVAI